MSSGSSLSISAFAVTAIDKIRHLLLSNKQHITSVPLLTFPQSPEHSPIQAVLFLIGREVTLSSSLISTFFAQLIPFLNNVT